MPEFSDGAGCVDTGAAGRMIPMFMSFLPRFVWML